MIGALPADAWEIAKPHQNIGTARNKKRGRPDFTRRTGPAFRNHIGFAKSGSFPKSAPFAADFLTAMGQVIDFWAEPSYAQLMLSEQKRIHDFVVADKGTAKETLDLLIKDWSKVFADDGKI